MKLGTSFLTHPARRPFPNTHTTMLQPKPKVRGHDILTFDLMQDGRYRATLHFEYAPLFPIKYEELEAFVKQQRPVLYKQGCEFKFSLRKGQAPPVFDIPRKYLRVVSR